MALFTNQFPLLIIVIYIFLSRLPYLCIFFHMFLMYPYVSISIHLYPYFKIVDGFQDAGHSCTSWDGCCEPYGIIIAPAGVGFCYFV